MVEYSRLTEKASVFVGKVVSIKQQVVIGDEIVCEDLDRLEARLLPMLEIEAEALKELVAKARVVTTISIQVLRPLVGNREEGGVLALTVIDKVGDLCPKHRQLPLRGKWEKVDYVWSVDVVVGPLETKVQVFRWTTVDSWSEIKN